MVVGFLISDVLSDRKIKRGLDRKVQEAEKELKVEQQERERVMHEDFEDMVKDMIKETVRVRRLDILKRMKVDTINDLKARNKHNYIRRGNHL